jgi:hypothetical protein
MTALAMIRQALLGTLIVSAVSGISPAWAQFTPTRPTPAPVSNPTPNAGSIALAKELLALKGGAQMFDGMVIGVIESAKNSFLPSNPTLNKPLTEVSTQLRQEFEPKMTELFNEVSKAYARHFTEQELKELLAFYRTTLGKKVLSTESLAVEDGFKRAQDWTNEFSDAVLSRMRAEMKKRGYDL